MAVKVNLLTSYGETRELYVRVNNLSVSNHGVDSPVLFRGYLGQAEFQAGGNFVYELEASMAFDVAQPIWEQAYTQLKQQFPDFAQAVDC
jgi:hypothetical protein